MAVKIASNTEQKERNKTTNLSNLANSIANHQCALFTGAGLTATSGGATWEELIVHLKKEFHYSSPLKDNFKIIGDMCKEYGKDKIYSIVKKRLGNTKLSTSIEKMTKMPWFTVFTTNYDLALDKSLVKNQSLIVRTILTGQEFALTGIQSEILLVKLMGSLDVSYEQPGHMVLDLGDLVIAREERKRIFDIFSTHAANLSFLFVGYSFNDDLFFEILEKLITTIGEPSSTYYAVFPKEPDQEKAYLLKKSNVEIIVADLETFVNQLYEQVSIRNPKDFSLVGIPIGNEITPLKSTNISNFLSTYNPVITNNWKEIVSPNAFFKGYTNSFNPSNFLNNLRDCSLPFPI